MSEIINHNGVFVYNYEHYGNQRTKIMQTNETYLKRIIEESFGATAAELKNMIILLSAEVDKQNEKIEALEKRLNSLEPKGKNNESNY
jgi:dynactin complex subunit